MQECHFKALISQSIGASLFVDILLGLGSSEIWGKKKKKKKKKNNWKKRIHQAFPLTHQTLERKAATQFLLFILLAPTLP